MAKLYVQHTHSNEIRAFDESGGDPLAVISEGGGWRPDSVTLSKDGALLFSNWKDLDYLRASKRTPSRSLFMAHDAHTLEEVWRLPLEGAVEHFAASPCKRYVWNAVSDRPWAIRVDTETQTADTVQIRAVGGHKVRVSADGRRCYIGSIMTCELTEIDTETLRLSRSAAFDDYVRPFDLTRDGRFAYIQLSRLHGFVAFDLERWQITQRIALPKLPPETPVEAEFPFTVDHGVEVTPDDEQLLLLATTGNALHVVSLPDLELQHTIALGVEPSYLTLDSTAEKVYVTNRITCDVHIIERATWRVIGRFETGGKRPQRICVGV